jgi:outer membrane protein TolC
LPSRRTFYSHPFSLVWPVGAAAAESIFDAGKRKRNTGQFWANYWGIVSNYRQTVMTAFQ